MTAAWMLYVLLVGSLLAVGALALDGILRRTTLPTRWVWVAALGGIVALAVLAPGSVEPTRGPIAGASIAPLGTTVADRSVAGIMSAGLAEARTTLRTAVNGALVAANARIPSFVAIPIAVSWALVSGALLIVIVIVNRRANYDRHTWPLAEVHGTRVRIAPEVGPAVVGLTHPEIVLPQWLLRRSAEEQQLVVLHEREHVAARDQLLPVGGWIVAALVPWHPAVWWALSRLRLAVELDCDARVLTRGVHTRSYGTLLIDIAGQCAGHRAGALALADRPSHLERRLLAMKQTRPRFALVRSGTLGALAALSILVACEARMPSSAEVEKMDVAGAEKAAVQSKMVDEEAVKHATYTVDGRAATVEEAKAVGANRIVGVRIRKSATAGGAAQIDIDTRLVPTTVDASGAPMTISTNDMKLTTEHGTLTGSKTPFAGLLYVNGVLTPTSWMETMSPANIASVEVIKGVAAGNGDSTAGNGIIRITTKRAKP